ncbi:inositol monophosphatase [Buttiauxella noackiae ATCC 51607]|uniref:Inositol monophosphatase n=1 Tax=Buttiauxella noackiae ATCC 51607 TaxID=1354255 RepID=A0A1B7HPC5_9ENTR|nr:inositol monophosphatase family protein [Buttiauxella noackiae]OAT17492.1 inositol monophosphatase [Buttiauxella noackiae ATCC 51607]
MLCEKAVDAIKKRLPDILKLRNEKRKKEDDSYVSEGDLLVQTLILAECRDILPDHTIISEELAPFTNENWRENGSYIIIDPIDGTENFVSGLKEWGVGISVYTNGKHEESCIYLPELDEKLITGGSYIKYDSRICGLSSSLSKSDLLNLPAGFEYRIIGCSMYNMLNAIKGSYLRFDNVKGVNCWDILPGLNLALEHNIPAYIDGEKYSGQILFPVKKYKISIGVGCE